MEKTITSGPLNLLKIFTLYLDVVLLHPFEQHFPPFSQPNQKLSSYQRTNLKDSSNKILIKSIKLSILLMIIFVEESNATKIKCSMLSKSKFNKWDNKLRKLWSNSTLWCSKKINKMKSGHWTMNWITLSHKRKNCLILIRP